MLKNRQASDDEATVLAERLQARLQLAHPLRYTTVYSSVLTAPQAVRILSSDDATTTGVVTDPFMKLSAAELAHLKATDEVLDSARRFFVTVRNLDRDEEYAHPEPLETLKDWHLHFLDRPIFRLVNVAKEPDFVTLQAPTARNLWATTKLVKAEQLFHVVVSFAPLAPSSILPNLYTDTVLVYLRTPRLPTDHVTFRSLMRTSDQRRAVALHYALQAFAKQFGFRVYPGASAAAAAPVPPRPADPALQQATAQATLLHGDRVVISDACTTTTLCGAVVSGVSETSAGSVVIPLVLKFVRFLLPALRDNVPLCYDLVQPHRFGYTFQVNYRPMRSFSARSLAGLGLAIFRHGKVAKDRAEHLAVKQKSLLIVPPSAGAVHRGVAAPWRGEHARVARGDSGSISVARSDGLARHRLGGRRRGVYGGAHDHGGMRQPGAYSARHVGLSLL